MAVLGLPGIVSGALDELARAVRDRFGERVSEIVLFGSYARGGAGEDSDVDVLVVIDALTDREELEVVDLASAIKRGREDWVGLAPLPLSTSRARDLRSRGRLLWRDIAAEGVPL
jgi:predicted nucleotidyltransferase